MPPSDRYRSRLALSLLAIALVALAARQVLARDDDAHAPYRTWNSMPAITVPPLLRDPSGRSVAVEWMTDSDADGSVHWAEQGEGGGAAAVTQPDHVSVAQHDGLVDVGRFHRVVLRGLRPGHRYRYRVVSRRVVAIRSYWPERGLAVQSAPARFRTLDPDRLDARFAVITDTHEDVPRLRALLTAIDPARVDFVVHDGDTVDHADSERQLADVLLTPLAEAIDGRTPWMYARGNHEYRGPFARALGRYLKAPEGRYDFDRDDGPVHLIVLDTGEDKPDATQVYAGLNDLAGAFQRLRAMLRAPRVTTAPFAVLLARQKDFGRLDGHNADWMNAANVAQVDLFIAGHEHRFERIAPGSPLGNRFPILLVGQDPVATVSADRQRLSVRVTRRDGTLVEAFTLRRHRK
jgi:acid phosphatase type 7